MAASRLTRTALIAAVVAGGAAAAVALRRATRQSDATTHVETNRIRRTATLASMSAKSAAIHVQANARAAVAPSHERQAIRDRAHLRSAEQITETLGNMKGAVMKLAQIMSFAAEGLPDQMKESLSTLQSEAPPMSWELASDVLREEFGKEPNEIFGEIETEPAAAASIGQVHRAWLRDGTPVAVKIQYPGVGDAIRSDLDNAAFLNTIGGIMMPGFDPKPVVDELKARILDELDYRLEARHQIEFGRRYLGHPFIRIPRVHLEQSTERVLTMEWIDGRRFDEVLAGSETERQDAAEKLYRFVFGALYLHRAFNGDPHPGNYLFCEDGRVAFLDFGCVKHFRQPVIESFIQLIATVHDGDMVAFRALWEKMGFIKEGAKVSDADLIEYFFPFWDPVRHDAVYTYTSEWCASLSSRLANPASVSLALAASINMPGDLLMIQRINVGLNSILARLGATNNWYRIWREYVAGGEPCTPLGVAEAEWAIGRAAADHDPVVP